MSSVAIWLIALGSIFLLFLWAKLYDKRQDNLYSSNPRNHKISVKSQRRSEHSGCVCRNCVPTVRYCWIVKGSYDAGTLNKHYKVQTHAFKSRDSAVEYAHRVMNEKDHYFWQRFV